jgi:hypothetical protein
MGRVWRARGGRKVRKYSKPEERIIREIKNNRHHVCYFCLKHIEEDDDLTVDHLYPYDGNNTNEENCVISCKSCNNEKGAMNEGEYSLFKSYKLNMSEKTTELILLEQERVVEELKKHNRKDNFAFDDDNMLLMYKAKAVHILLKERDSIGKV